MSRHLKSIPVRGQSVVSVTGAALFVLFVLLEGSPTDPTIDSPILLLLLEVLIVCDFSSFVIVMFFFLVVVPVSRKLDEFSAVDVADVCSLFLIFILLGQCVLGVNPSKSDCLPKFEMSHWDLTF